MENVDQYLLSELERVVERGTIQWSADSAEAPHHRVERLSTELVRIAPELRGGVRWWYAAG